MTAQPVLVILAAGASTRLGEPKALVELHGSMPAQLLLDAWHEAAGEGAACVLISGAHHPQLAATLESRVELLHNPRWCDGRTSGLALAAKRWPERDLLVAPVDCPLVPAEVLGALLREWTRLGLPAQGFLAPYLQREGSAPRFGHPIVLGRFLAAQLSLMPPQASLRELRELASPLSGLAVSNREILDNLDTQADLSKLRKRGPNRASDGPDQQPK